MSELHYPCWEEDEGPAVVWGGLLHDLGKVFQRMGSEFRRMSHPAAGVAILRKRCPWLPPQALEAVETHHEPRSPVGRLVALADHLSAGERVQAPASEEGTEALLSPFSWVGHEGEEAAVGRGPGARYFPLAPLSKDTQTLFPHPDPPGPSELEQRYQGLAQGLGRELAVLSSLEQEMGPRLETWLYLLQRWLWGVPAAVWRSVPDTSLYEHLRNTAALATVLWQWTKAQAGAMAVVEDLLRQGTRSRFADEPVAGLLHGDLSGLQDFLYRVSSKGALRGLKGRSFYLQALCDVIARWVLRHLGLPPCNLIYSGGGHFFVLTPRPELVPVDRLRRELARRLLGAHGPDLYMALGLVPMTPRHFWERFAEAWRDAGQATAQEKARRFSHLGPADLTAAMGPQPHESGDPQLACESCGRESKGLTSEPRLCPFCHSLQELGQDLRRPGLLLLEEVPERQPSPAPSPRPWQEALEVFGFRPRYIREGSGLRDDVQGVLLSLGDPEVMGKAKEWLERRPLLALGFASYACATPLASEGSAERVMEFEELAEASKGIVALGVVRMDVDDLGRLFTRDGPPDSPPPSLGRMATVSFLLRLFFEMEVARLCQAVNQGQGEKAYLIYSGGDDLFIVTSWSLAPRLAREIRERICQFFGPAVTASAGVLVDSPHAPLYHLAAEAGELLERAKAWMRDGRAKDAVCFLAPEWVEDWGTFPAEEEAAQALAQEIADGLPRGLLIFLQHLGHQVAVQRVEGKPTSRWHWLAAYHLARLRERLPKEGSPIVDRLWQELVCAGYGQPEIPQRWARIARWAELLTRSRT